MGSINLNALEASWNKPKEESFSKVGAWETPINAPITPAQPLHDLEKKAPVTSFNRGRDHASYQNPPQSTFQQRSPEANTSFQSKEPSAPDTSGRYQQPINYSSPSQPAVSETNIRFPHVEKHENVRSQAPNRAYNDRSPSIHGSIRGFNDQPQQSQPSNQGYNDRPQQSQQPNHGSSDQSQNNQHSNQGFNDCSQKNQYSTQGNNDRSKQSQYSSQEYNDCSQQTQHSNQSYNAHYQQSQHSNQGLNERSAQVQCSNRDYSDRPQQSQESSYRGHDDRPQHSQDSQRGYSDRPQPTQASGRGFSSRPKEDFNQEKFILRSNHSRDSSRGFVSGAKSNNSRDPIQGIPYGQDQNYNSSRADYEPRGRSRGPKDEVCHEVPSPPAHKTDNRTHGSHQSQVNTPAQKPATLDWVDHPPNTDILYIMEIFFEVKGPKGIQTKTFKYILFRLTFGSLELAQQARDLFSQASLKDLLLVASDENFKRPTGSEQKPAPSNPAKAQDAKSGFNASASIHRRSLVVSDTHTSMTPSQHTPKKEEQGFSFSKSPYKGSTGERGPTEPSATWNPSAPSDSPQTFHRTANDLVTGAPPVTNESPKTLLSNWDTPVGKVTKSAAAYSWDGPIALPAKPASTQNAPVASAPPANPINTCDAPVASATPANLSGNWDSGNVKEQPIATPSMHETIISTAPPVASSCKFKSPVINTTLGIFKDQDTSCFGFLAAKPSASAVPYHNWEPLNITDNRTPINSSTPNLSVHNSPPPNHKAIEDEGCILAMNNYPTSGTMDDMINMFRSYSDNSSDIDIAFVTPTLLYLKFSSLEIATNVKDIYT